MGRDDHKRARDKNTQKLPQVPKSLKTDGEDVEYSEELSNHEDREAMARAKAADERADH